MNKRIFLRRVVSVCMLFWISAMCYAQSDTIFLRNGQHVVCKVNELFFHRVSYTVYKNDLVIGPDYFDNVDIKRIVYANGETRFFNISKREREELQRALKHDEQGGIYLEGSGRVTAQDAQTPFEQMRRFYTEMHGPVNSELIRDDASAGVLDGKARGRTAYRVEGVANAQDLPVFLMFDVQVTLSGMDYRFKISHILVHLTRGAQREITLEKLMEGYYQSGLAESLSEKDYQALSECLFFYVTTLTDRVNRDMQRQMNREPRTQRPE